MPDNFCSLASNAYLCHMKGRTLPAHSARSRRFCCFRVPGAFRVLSPPRKSLEYSVKFCYIYDNVSFYGSFAVRHVRLFNGRCPVNV